jgi:flagellar biosynthesis chaperone FliJ
MAKLLDADKLVQALEKLEERHRSEFNANQHQAELRASDDNSCARFGR